MKTASVADLRNHFNAVSKWIQNGNKVAITMRGKQFAVLSPIRKTTLAADWPDFEGRMGKTFKGRLSKGSTAARIMNELRGDF